MAGKEIKYGGAAREKMMIGVCLLSASARTRSQNS